MTRRAPTIALLPSLLGVVAACAPELTEAQIHDLRAFRMVDQTEAMLDGHPPIGAEPEREQLGAALFFDCGLSAPLPAESPLGAEGEVERLSCASCHDPDHGGASDEPVQFGVAGPTTRNAPTILNSGWRESFGWFAGYTEMWLQIQVPLFKGPHGLTPETLTHHLRTRWPVQYEAAWGPDWAEPPLVADRSARALESYVRTLETGPSRFDLWLDQPNRHPLTPTELHGAILFVDKAGCDTCHSGPLLSDGACHSLGLDAPLDDEDCQYHTPGLRNVSLTAPYFHDGSAADLHAVIDLYDDGGGYHGSELLDRRIRPLGLTNVERHALVAFLHALEGERPPGFEASPCD